MSVIVCDHSSEQCAVKLLSAVIVGQGLKLHWCNLAICSHLKFDNWSDAPQLHLCPVPVPPKYVIVLQTYVYVVGC